MHASVAPNKDSFFVLRLADDRRLFFPKPTIMGIINLSPDSFYNPHQNILSALETAKHMIESGAGMLDIGIVATNPKTKIGASKALAPQKLKDMVTRVVETVVAIKRRWEVLISIDTSHPEVMREAVAAGADFINDQCALHEEGALETLVGLKVPVCLMHFFPSDRVPGSASLSDVLGSVQKTLQMFAQRCLSAGIHPERIVIDPGFGQGHFKKNILENFYLLNHLPEIVKLGYPVLSGWSRKSMIGDLLAVDVTERLSGSLAVDTLATYHGACIIRTHDVKATVQASVMARYARCMSLY